MSAKNLLGKLLTLTNPILNGNAFRIRTAPCVALFEEIQEWLLNGIAAGFVVGPPRHGKTSAVRWSLKALDATLGAPVKVYEIPCRFYEETRERDFFTYLLESCRHRDPWTGTAGERRGRFMAQLLFKAKASPYKMVILYFDEAQFLTRQHWNWLLNMSNEAVVAGYKIFYIFSGPDELLALREDYIVRGRVHMTGRYMTSVHELTGLTTAIELEDCLEEFSATIYPATGTICLIDHFVNPERYPNFILRSYGSTMWSIFLERRRMMVGEQRNDHMVVPMHYATAAMLRFLTELAINDRSQAIEAALHKAVARCGFDDFVRSTVYVPLQREVPLKGQVEI